MNEKELKDLLAELDDDMMEEEETSSKSKIDFTKMFSILWERRKSFYISIPITFVVAVILSLSIPKTYTVEVKLAPEMASISGLGSSGLGSIMKTFGLSTASSSGNTDAIIPTLYPDLMNSNLFLVGLFDIPVETRDGELKTSYYDYLAKHQKRTWWSKAIGALIKLIPLPESDSKASKKGATDKRINASMLTKKQTMVVKAISDRIQCGVDKKTGVITIMVQDQDPMICAAIADSTCQHLQDFITEYRTKKAFIELEDTRKQYQKAQADYELAKSRVEQFNDANWDIVQEEFLVEKQALQNDMQLKFSTFSTINTQLIAARAKYESLRPVFTVLDGATVPLRPTGPKKKGIVLGLLFLVLSFQSLWMLRKYFKEEVFGKKEEITVS